jgi:hypothetical protein
MAKLSPLQKAYRKYFKEMLKLYNADSPAQIKPEARKKSFFNNIKKFWNNGNGPKENWKDKVKLVEESKQRLEEVKIRNKKQINQSVIMENYLRRLIKEEYQTLLKEENELLKAQDNAKGTMFKIKKAYDALYKKAESKNILQKGWKTQISPYNDGYELKHKNRITKDAYEKIKAGDLNKIIYFLDGGSYINYQPASFFQSYIDEGKPGTMEGFYDEYQNDKFKLTTKRYKINNKKDIKKAGDEFYKEVLKTIDIINKELK